MADPSADVPRASTARPAVASMCMGRAEQKRMHQHIRRLIALFRCEFPGRHITAIVIQLNGDIRFHFADEGGAASSSSLGPAACGRPSKPGPPHSVRSPTTSNAARTSTSTSTVSRKERRRRGWQFRGICKRIASRRALLAAFHGGVSQVECRGDGHRDPGHRDDVAEHWHAARSSTDAVPDLRGGIFER
jgi:hypothetical protein